MKWHEGRWGNSPSILKQHVCLFMASDGPVCVERGSWGSSEPGSLAFIKCHYQYFGGAGWAETRLPLCRYLAMHMDAFLIPLIHH